jgi:hypothetical protein
MLIVALCIFAGASSGLAAPIRPLGPVDVGGIVSDFHWYPEKKEKGIRGMSGSAGVDRVMHAHFLVTLKAVEGVDPQTAVTMTRYFDSEAFKYEDKNFMPTFVVMKINHNDKNFLKKGMKIKVFGYTIRGDEGGTWTYYSKIDIVDKPSPADTIQRYLEASIESPNSGGKMFCAYELLGKDTSQRTQYIYVWATCMEYSVKNGKLEQGVGISLPVSLMAEDSPGGLIMKGHRKPVDGEGYGASIRKIFPQQYHNAIFAQGQQYNRRAESLQKDTERQARVYYKLQQ